MSLGVVKHEIGRLLQIAIRIVLPRERTLMMRPVPTEISSGEVDNWATVISVVSVMPRAQPRRMGYPQTGIEVYLVVTLSSPYK